MAALLCSSLQAKHWILWCILWCTYHFWREYNVKHAIIMHKNAYFVVFSSCAAIMLSRRSASTILNVRSASPPRVCMRSPGQVEPAGCDEFWVCRCKPWFNSSPAQLFTAGQTMVQFKSCTATCCRCKPWFNSSPVQLFTAYAKHDSFQVQLFKSHTAGVSARAMLLTASISCITSAHVAMASGARIWIDWQVLLTDHDC